MYLWAPYVCLVRPGHKKMSDALELELWTAVSCLSVWETTLGPLQEQLELSAPEPSLLPLSLFY